MATVARGATPGRILVGSLINGAEIGQRFGRVLRGQRAVQQQGRVLQKLFAQPPAEVEPGTGRVAQAGPQARLEQLRQNFLSLSPAEMVLAMKDNPELLTDIETQLYKMQQPPEPITLGQGERAVNVQPVTLQHLLPRIHGRSSSLRSFLKVAVVVTGAPPIDPGGWHPWPEAPPGWEQATGSLLTASGSWLVTLLTFLNQMDPVTSGDVSTGRLIEQRKARNHRQAQEIEVRQMLRAKP